MALSIIKETIEQNEPIATDSDGNIYLTKRVNLKRGYRHNLLQVDCFEDSTMTIYSEPNNPPSVEVVISPYPAIPTDMAYSAIPSMARRYPAAGDDSILYKEKFWPVREGNAPSAQFPSPEIAAQNKSYFYTDHLYINLCIHGSVNTTYGDIAFSFMFVLEDKKVPYLEHTLGVLAENHSAMCALVMSNGRMQSIESLEGNVFPMWRFGGIRPEHMVKDTFWLQVSSTEDEPMATTTVIRGQVSSARQMAAFDSAFGTPKYPDWIRMNLNQGITTGPIRPDPVPLKYADNGNTRMF